MSAPSPYEVPAGYLPRAVVFWTGFHFKRNLRKRAFKLWTAAFVITILLLRYGARVSPEELARAVLLLAVPLLALFFGAGSLREEIEDQTLTYAFTRPVGRIWTYVARVLANGLPMPKPMKSPAGTASSATVAMNSGLRPLKSIHANPYAANAAIAIGMIVAGTAIATELRSDLPNPWLDSKIVR